MGARDTKIKTLKQWEEAERTLKMQFSNVHTRNAMSLQTQLKKSLLEAFLTTAAYRRIHT